MYTDLIQAPVGDDGVTPDGAAEVMVKSGDGAVVDRSVARTFELTSNVPSVEVGDGEFEIAVALVAASVQYWRTNSYLFVVPISWLIYETWFVHSF